MLYFLISFIACIIGAISGIGGGIIIKPLLDALSTYSLAQISILSNTTVLTMAIVSLWKNRQSDAKINRRISLNLALGGILGGVLGKSLFDTLLTHLSSDGYASALQAALLILLNLWIIAYLKMKARFPVYHVQNTLISLAIGLVLGGVASFLGIGGGPINIAVLAIVFGMDSKTAALNSIYIIFFSQIANLSGVLLKSGVTAFLTLPPLPYMLIGAVAGGYVGSRIVKKMSNNDVDRFFMLVLILVSIINLYNFCQGLL